MANNNNNECGRLDEIADYLGDLKLNNPSDVSQKVLKKCVSNPTNHQHYIKVVTVLANTIIARLNEDGLLLQPVKTCNDVDAWIREIEIVLKALEYQGCRSSNRNVVELNKDTKFSILDFFVEEMECWQLRNAMMEEDHGRKEEEEEEERGWLKKACLALGLSLPPADVGPEAFFRKISENFGKRTLMGDDAPLLLQNLNPVQWKYLENLMEEMNDEYSLRRIMLLARLDATIQSFSWSSRLSDAKKEEVNQTYRRLRSRVKTRSEYYLCDVMSATPKTSIRFQKLSSSSNKASSSLTKVTMGRVPDRGGRPRECEAPPPEMPSWAPRTDNAGRGRGGGRGGAGGYSQGNRGRGRGGGGYHVFQGGQQYYEEPGNRDGNQRRGGYRGRGGYHNHEDAGSQEKRRRVQNAGWNKNRQ